MISESDYCDLIGGTWHKGKADVKHHDCWGMVQIVCGRQGIHVPSPDTIENHTERQAMTGDDLPGWVPIKHGAEQPGDVVAYSFAGKVVDHVGILVTDKLIMHSRKETGTVILPRKSFAKHLVEFWRPGIDTDNLMPEQIIGNPSSQHFVMRVYGNPFDLSVPIESICQPNGDTLADYMAEGIDVESCSLSLNGARLSDGAATRYRPKPGDLVEVVVRPGVTGAFLAGSAAGTEVAFGFTALAFVVNAIISVGASFLLKALTAPPQPSVDESPIDDSPTFSQSGIRNTIAAGGSIPVVIGEHRIGGQIIGTFNSISELTVSNFPSAIAQPNPTTTTGPFGLKQNTNNASATGGKTTLNLLIAVSEGEVESINGITSDQDNIDANSLAPETLLINGNQASDYTSVALSTRMGTAQQATVPGFENTTNAVGIEIALKYAQPWTYTTSQDVEAFHVQLFEAAGHFRIGSSNGATKIKQVFYRFWYKPTGAATWTYQTTIERTYLNRAAHSWDIQIENLPLGTYDIYVERITFDDDDQSFIASGDQSEVSEAQVNVINEITYGGSSHPGVAQLAVFAMATDQLNGAPTATSLIEGKKWWVWDGVSETNPDFVFQYTRNQGEILPGLMTNKVFGLGADIKLNNIDLAGFKALADYCDEVIDDGRGGTMSRWRLDMVYDKAIKAGDLIEQMMATCRASLLPIAGKISVKIHQAGTPSHLFSEGNVNNVKPGFTDGTNRPTRINVTFANAELDYDIDTISVEDANVTDGKFIEDTITVLGVTKPARAYRIAQHRLNVSGLTDALSFGGALDSVLLSPGDVFWFSHQRISTGHVSGRIKTAAAMTVTFDRDVTLIGSTAYKLKVMSTSTGAVVIEEVSIINLGTQTYAAGFQVPIVGSWTTIPADRDVYALGLATDYIKAYEAIECPLTPDLERSISAIEYDSTVFDDDPGDVPTSTDEEFDPRKFPAQLSGVTILEESKPQRSRHTNHALVVSWKPNKDFEEADIWLRYPETDTQWVLSGRGAGGSYHVHDFAYDETIECSVVPVAASGASQAAEFGAQARLYVAGRITKPTAPTNLVAEDGETGTLLSWDEPADFDVKAYQVKVGSSWAGGILVATVLACNKEVTIPPAWSSGASQTYRLKAISHTGIESDETTVAFAHDDRTVEITAEAQDTGWAGTKSNYSVVSTELVSDDSTTTASYLPRDINTTGTPPLFVNASPDVTFFDGTAPTWATAVWAWGSQGAKVRTWNDDDFSDYPDTRADAINCKWLSADFAWDSALADGRTWAGLSATNAFSVLLESRTAASSVALAAADLIPHRMRIDSNTYADAKITVTVPHADYKSRISTMRLGINAASPRKRHQYPAYIDMYASGNSSYFTTTFTNCPFDTVRAVASGGAYTLGSELVSVDVAPASGKVKVIVNISLQGDTTGLTTASVAIYHNGAAVTAAFTKFTTETANAASAGSSQCILSVSATDTIGVKAKRVAGSGQLRFLASSCNIRVEDIIEEE